jgi:hypothetical protein
MRIGSLRSAGERKHPDRLLRLGRSLTMENIETLGRKAAEKKDICKVRKCANVVTNDLQFGLVRAWEIIVQLYDLVDLEIRLFKNRDEATET